MQLINIPDISPPNDDFTMLDVGSDVDWIRLSGLPRNRLERHIRGVRLSRYRGALEAALAANAGSIVISHLPAMTTATSLALSGLNKNVRHLAFAFNFTKLPHNLLRHSLMRRSLRSVDRFVVFSEFEVDLYSKHFQIDPARFSTLMWAQGCPPVIEPPQKSSRQPYVTAIGGEGRDISLIVDAARHFIDDLDFVLITRPHMVQGVNIPPNVEVITNVPLGLTWGIAKNGLGVLVPLATPETCCGHITIVSAKMLGIPVVTTDSLATFEYISDRKNVLSGPAGERSAFIKNIEFLLDNGEELTSAARDAVPSESVLHSRTNWARFLTNYVDSNR